MSDLVDLSHSLFEVTDAPLSVDSLVESVLTGGDGAVVTFVGTVRDNHQGRSVLALEYEAYGGMAESEMRRIGVEMIQKHGLHGIRRLSAVHEPVKSPPFIQINGGRNREWIVGANFFDEFSVTW